MEKLLKNTTRTTTVERYANRYARRALREIEDSYRRMLEDMTDYTVKYRVSQSTL